MSGFEPLCIVLKKFTGALQIPERDRCLIWFYLYIWLINRGLLNPQQANYMGYKEEAIECVKDNVLPIHKQIYAKYDGDFDRIYSEGYNSRSYQGRVIEPGSIWTASPLWPRENAAARMWSYIRQMITRTCAGGSLRSFVHLLVNPITQRYGAGTGITPRTVIGHILNVGIMITTQSKIPDFRILNVGSEICDLVFLPTVGKREYSIISN